MCLSSEGQPGLQLHGLVQAKSSVLSNRECSLGTMAETEVSRSFQLTFPTASSKGIFLMEVCLKQLGSLWSSTIERL